MKVCKKLLTTVLTLAMLLSLCSFGQISASATGTVTSIIDKITFDDLEADAEYDASTANANIYSPLSPDETLSLYVTKKDGTKGYIRAGSGEKPAWDKYFTLSKSYGALTINNTTSTFSQGDQIRFSLDYLPVSDSDYFASGLRPSVLNGYIDSLFKFMKTKIVVNNAEYAIPESEQSDWVHVDIILTVGDGATGEVKDTFTTYINGVQKGTVDWENYCQNGKGLGRWDFIGKATIKIDNISLTRYTGGATFVPVVPSLISGGADISKGYTGTELYVANKTVAQAVAGLGTDANAVYSVVDANGAAVAESAAAAGNTLVITDINGVAYYVPMVGNTLKKTLTGADWSIGAVNSAASATVTTVTDFFGNDTAYKYEEIMDGDSGGTASLMTYATGYTNQAMYMRVPLFVESGKTNDILYITCKPYYTESLASGGHRIVKLEKGKVYVTTGEEEYGKGRVEKEVGTYKRGEWFVIEIALLPGQSYYTVKMNDGELWTGRLGDSANGFYNAFSKNDYFQLTMSNGTDSWYVGDTQLYSGVPTAVAAPSLTAVPAGTTLADNAITVPYGKDASAYINAGSITASNAPTVKFIGADGKSITEGYNGGKMVLISADGIYKYYTLNARQEACTLMSTDDAGNKTYWVDITTNDGSITPIIYNALFSGSVLDSVTTIDKQWVIDNTTFEFTAAPDSGSYTRKIFVWDKLTLIPLAGTLD